MLKGLGRRVLEINNAAEISEQESRMMHLTTSQLVTEDFTKMTSIMEVSEKSYYTVFLPIFDQCVYFP